MWWARRNPEWVNKLWLKYPSGVDLEKMDQQSINQAVMDKSPRSAFRPSHSRSNSTGSSRQVSVPALSHLAVCTIWKALKLVYFEHVQNSRDWEVMTDIESSTINRDKNSIPGICEGFLMKKRKYPLQGWHKVRRWCCEMMMLWVDAYGVGFALI